MKPIRCLLGFHDWQPTDVAPYWGEDGFVTAEYPCSRCDARWVEKWPGLGRFPVHRQ